MDDMKHTSMTSSLKNQEKLLPNLCQTEVTHISQLPHEHDARRKE